MKILEATLIEVVDDLEVLQSELGVTLNALMARREDVADEDWNEVELTDTDRFLIRRYAGVAIGDPLPPVSFTRSGAEWSEVVNDLEWAGEESAYLAIEAQLPADYGNGEQEYTVHLSGAHAHLTRATWEQLLNAGVEVEI